MDGPITISSTMWLHVSCIITSQGGLTLSLSLKSACCVFWPLFNQSSHLVIVVSSIHQGIALVRRCMGVGWVLVRRWSGIYQELVGQALVRSQLALVGCWSGIDCALVTGVGQVLVKCWSSVGQALVGHSWGIHQNCFLVLRLILFSGSMSEITGKRMRKSLVFTKETRQQCNNSLIFHAIHAQDHSIYLDQTVGLQPLYIFGPMHRL